MELDILEKYRDVECPELGDIDGRQIATHSKDEVLGIL